MSVNEDRKKKLGIGEAGKAKILDAYNKAGKRQEQKTKQELSRTNFTFGVDEKYINDFATAVGAGADKRGAKLEERAANIRGFKNANMYRLKPEAYKNIENILSQYDSKYKNGTPRPDQDKFDFDIALENAAKQNLKELVKQPSIAEKVAGGNTFGENKLMPPHSGELESNIPKFNATEHIEATKTPERSGGLLDFFDKGAFADGFDGSDLWKAPLATAADAAVGVVKGAVKPAENILDLSIYGNSLQAKVISKVAGLFGKESVAETFGDASSAFREWGSKDTVGRGFGDIENSLEKNSILGQTSKSIAEGIGQIGTMLLTGGMGEAAGLSSAGITALTSAETFLSGMGAGMTEAYENNANDIEATTYGAMAGAAEAISEMMFGGLGKGVNALGISRGIGSLDDIAAETVTKKIKNTLVKNLAQGAIKAGGEGLEEVVAGLLQAAAQNFTYMSEKDYAELVSDQNLLESFIVGLLTSAMAQVPSLVQSTAEGVDFVTGRTDAEQSLLEKATKEALAKATEESENGKISLKEKNAIRDDVLDEFEFQKAIKKAVTTSSTTESDAETLPVGKIGEVSVGMGKGGSYEVKLTETEGEGENVTLDIDSLPDGSTKTILLMAEEAGMTPASAQALVESYDGKTNVNEFIEEAEYIFSMGKVGTPISSVARVNVSEEMKGILYSDGESLTQTEVAERTRAIKVITDKATRLMTAGSFDDSAVKGMKLNRTQERSVKFAEALSKIGFNIKLVTKVSGNKKALGSYNKETGVIELNVNARLTDSHGNLRSQILPTLSHEITHQIRDTAPELYEEFKSVVLGAFTKSGDIQSLIDLEVERLKNTGRYGELSDTAIYDLAVDEIIARSAEDMLTNDKVIEQIFRENRTVGEKILQFITDFVERLKETIKGIDAKSTREEARILREMVDEFEAARDAWAKAFQRTREVVSAVNEVDEKVKASGESIDYNESSKKENSPAKKYFVEDKYFKSQMAKWEDLKHGAYVKVGEIGSEHPLHMVGMPTGVLRYDVDKLKRNMSDHGDYLTVDLLKAIPEIIAKPIAISEYSAENTVSVFGDIFVGKSPMMVGVTISKDNAGNDISKVRTFNARKDVGKLITNETILYLNENKKETRKWFLACGIQVPLGETKFGFIRSISQKSGTVNKKFSEIVEKSSTNDLYSESPADMSMREVLTDALLETVQTDAESDALKRYRKRVREIDGYEARLAEVNREIKEISFAKGKRDTVRLSELKREKAALEQDLRRADRKLLELESTAAIKRLFASETKRIREAKAKTYRESVKEVKRLSRAELEAAVDTERTKARAAIEGQRISAEKRLSHVKAEAARRELADRTRRKRYEVGRRVENTIKYITSQTDDKNVKQGLRGVVADFAHAILSNDAAYTQSEMTRMRKKYEEIAEAGEGVEFIHRGAYDFDIQEELEQLEASLNGRAWRDLTLDELDTVDRVTRNVMHMIRLENKIFRNGKAESRVKIGEACERAIAECVSRRGEKTTPKGTVGQGIQRFGEAVDSLIVTGNLMPVYYFDILGGEFEELYNDLVNGQNKWARIIEGSARKASEIKKKYDFKKLTKGKTVFTTDEGVSFEMTVREAMYFYAAFKRETLRGDTEHYLKGGIASSKIVAKTKGDDVKRYRSGTVRLSGDDAAMILDSLTSEQKAFADELVTYLSTDIARYGNETSMDLYGIEKFGDEYYIPYRVSDKGIPKDPVEAAEPDKKGKGGGELKIKHTGSTNAIKPGASNAMEQADIMDVFTQHCVEMANYAAFAVPIENIGGVLNFKGANGEFLRAEMERKLGDNMTRYLDTFIRDMNGGVKTQAAGIEKFLSLQKKASVAASLSTVVQQPTAMLRAMAMIDPKYFATVKGGETMQGVRASWDEMKAYAPGVTVVKDMGKFDVGSGMSAAEYINSDMTFGKAVDKAAGFAAEWADKLTWIHIWKACKAEAKANGLRGEALLKSAGERFTDVINRTQVYDSTLVRSENMRSRNAFMKPFTAFKAEPTVTLNVMADAVRSKSPAKIARTASVFVITTVVNNALRALVYAGRDDDEEKGYLEKYGVEFSEGLAEDLMLWNYVPFVSDLASITKGFKSKRMEMQLFESVYNSFNALWEDDAGWREWATFVGDVGNFAGLPVKNVIRDFIMMPMNIASSSESSLQGAWYAAVDAIAGSTTGKNLEKIGINISNTDYDGYIEALEGGDEAEAEKIFGAIVEYKMFKARRKAEAEGSDFDEDEARKAAESSVRGKITEHLKDSYDGYLKALEDGDTKGAAKLYGDITGILVNYERVRSETRGEKFDEKKALASAETSLQSRVTMHFKKRYVAADYDERTAIRQILRSTGLYDNVRSTTKAWLKSTEEEDE